MKEMRVDFEALLSDEVFLSGVVASDVRSLWRSLAKNGIVRSVSRGLASDPERIQGLCAFVKALLQEEHSQAYRHPHDIAMCAALLLLEQSPLPGARNLFARLRAETRPCLSWVRLMAAYCDNRFAEAARYCYSQRPAPGLPVRSIVCGMANLQWQNKRLEQSRFSLQPA